MMAHKAVAVKVVAVVSCSIKYFKRSPLIEAKPINDSWHEALNDEKIELLYFALKFREYVSQHKKI